MPDGRIHARALREPLAAGRMSREILGADGRRRPLRRRDAARRRLRPLRLVPAGRRGADVGFDRVPVHAGLHPCRSPHRALREMMRVAAAASSWPNRGIRS